MQRAVTPRGPLDPCPCGAFGRHRGIYVGTECLVGDFDLAKGFLDGEIETLEASVTFFKGVKTHCAEVDRELGDAETSVAELAKALRSAEQRRERARAGVRAVRQLLGQASAQCSRACRGATVSATQLIGAEADYVGALPVLYAQADIEAMTDAAAASVNARLRATRIGVQRWSDMSGDDADRAAAHAVYASFAAAVGKTRLAEVLRGNMNAQARPPPSSGQQVATPQNNQQPTTKKKGKNSKKKRNNNRSEPYARPEAYARPSREAHAVREAALVQPKREELEEHDSCNFTTKLAAIHRPEKYAENLDYEQAAEHAEDSGYHASPDHEHAQEPIDQVEYHDERIYGVDLMNCYDVGGEPEQDDCDAVYDEQHEYDEADERYGQEGEDDRQRVR